MKTIIISSFLLLVFLIFVHPMLIKGEQYNITDFGASRNAKIDSSRAFLSIWEAACNDVTSTKSIPPTIYVPKGKYLIESALVFSGQNCKTMSITNNNNKGIVFRIEGTLVAPDDYMVLRHVGTWITFESVSDVTIYGGSIDGRGRGLWSCKTNKESGCPRGATTLRFQNSKHVQIRGLRSVNRQLYHIVIDQCENVVLQRLRVRASKTSPNTDGIHVQSSSHVSIFDSNIGTGDDCISLGAGATDLWINNVVCGPGHGISIGSLGKSMNEPGVENVTVTKVVFKGTLNGVRIKSWGRPSNGFVKNIVFRNIIMNDVLNPIIIDQNYCPSHRNCPDQSSGVEVSDVIYQDIHGSSSTEVAVKFDCSPRHPCNRIRMKNVDLSYKGQLARSSCANAGGTTVGIVEPSSCIKETA